MHRVNWSDDELMGRDAATIVDAFVPMTARDAATDATARVDGSAPDGSATPPNDAAVSNDGAVPSDGAAPSDAAAPRDAAALGDAAVPLVYDPLTSVPVDRDGDGTFEAFVCKPGYNLSGAVCIDVDECATTNGGCDPRTACTNVAGGRTCTACPAGYTGSGAAGCVDTNECAANNGGCLSPTMCVNTMGSFMCTGCGAGYAGTGLTGCVDVDECTANSDNCDPAVSCTNTAGSFTCGACASGFTTLPSGGCLDIDECTAVGASVCSPHAVSCTNQPGTVLCGACAAGYAGDGRTCVEIDECVTAANTCVLPALCQDALNAITCICPTGSTLVGATCVAADACTTPANNCVAPATCVSGVAGAVTCDCPDDYVSDVAGTGCTPLDSGVIDFETLPDGSATTEAQVITTQYTPKGVSTFTPLVTVMARAGCCADSGRSGTFATLPAVPVGFTLVSSTSRVRFSLGHITGDVVATARNAANEVVQMLAFSAAQPNVNVVDLTGPGITRVELTQSVPGVLVIDNVSLGSARRGPAPVLLGTAGGFVLLAKTAISNVPTSAITGDVGISPAAATFITGFPYTKAGIRWTTPEVTGSIFAADNDPPTPSNLTTAISDMETAYTDAAGRPTPDFLELHTGAIGGKTLTPGLYKWTSSVTVTADIELSGGPNDVWIFQIAGDFAMSSQTRMTLIGGALAKNVFWQVAGNVDLGTSAHAEGIFVSMTSINLQGNSSVNGRLLAQTAIHLAMSTVSAPVQ
jgi:hypothetical protein